MATELKNLIPTMTSDTFPSGQSFGDDLLDSSLYKYWYAFNNIDSQSWTSTNTAFPHYIGYEFTSKTKVSQYTIRSRNFDNNDLTAMVKSWEFQGSDDNSNWITIDTRINIVWTSKAQDIDFLLGRAVEYKYYRLKVNANNGYAQTLCTIGQLKLFYDSAIYNRITIKNPTTNEIYSLSDNTLIHLPDNSTKNMILHGIEQGKEIQLDVPFDKHRYFNENPVANVSGKVFTHDIGVINTLSIKEVKESGFEPIYTWYTANMTSNTSPAPLVASASSEFSNDFGSYRAFRFANADNFSWVTANNNPTGYIQLKFGNKEVVNVLIIQSRLLTTDQALGNNQAPKDFEILASNDNNQFVKIAEFKGETNWNPNIARTFTFNNETPYQFYKVNITANNGSAWCSIGRLQFGYKREVN